LDVLPALVMAHPGSIGVGQLIDQDDLGAAGEDCLHVHLGELGAAVVDGDPGQHLEGADRLGGARPSVGLDEAEDHVLAAVAPVPTLAQHGEGLARAGHRSQVGLEPAPGRERRTAQAASGRRRGVAHGDGRCLVWRFGHRLPAHPDGPARGRLILCQVYPGRITATLPPDAASAADQPSAGGGPNALFMVRLSWRTSTSDSPKIQRTRPVMLFSTRACTWAAEMPRASATMLTCARAAATLMSGSKLV